MVYLMAENLMSRLCLLVRYVLVVGSIGEKFTLQAPRRFWMKYTAGIRTWVNIPLFLL